MIDSNTYRLSESLALRQSPTWQLANIHTIPFENHAFPRKLSSNQELIQLIDVMQEGRFQEIMHEMGGFTDSEYKEFLCGLEKVIELQWLHLPGTRPILPISTLISHFLIAKKIHLLNTNAKSILEIGSGCGYVPYFLNNDIENYSQIESCEAFYILQSLVNSQIFGPMFEERALPQCQESSASFFTTAKSLAPTTNHLEYKPKAKCVHYPWWRLGEVASHNNYFDVITSNANLCEIHDYALDDYLKLFKTTLKEDGIIFSQCIGGFIYRDWKKLCEKLYENGFAPLFFLATGRPTEIKHPIHGKINKQFAVGQALLIKEGHTLFEKYHRIDAYQEAFLAPESIALKLFEPSTDNRNMITEENIKNDITNILMDKYK